MHNFNELIQYSTSFNLTSINKETKNLYRNLTTNANTSNIKMLQMIELQKVIISIGMFSMFDAIVQNELNCKNGFKRINEILIDKNEIELQNSFQDLSMAINVLKHGKGRSYESLLKRIDSLKFKIKKYDEIFFDEGDISEVNTLIKVDDEFVLYCSDVIHEVYNAVLK
ncbi:hypothetical protein [Aliarcobacter butzleri]|uniref:hypothetical protein n=1 Tax=Aliarcobacter butzleri TaxID=28197 RepID=UPI00102D8380|nr:hypothetical protein [Aliarcobacter butzleri]MDK2082708.1 hypothetical protein [Aliarcobacter butzleri]MDN5096689.1 hypothetical protein [Aliarcobacter butzleri]MDN5128009.1 hypothetical protein [Aliarcobacter butzleri]RZV19076.1 hypothetical protein D3M75_03900 [Aliarcobacter butzleri]